MYGKKLFKNFLIFTANNPQDLFEGSVLVQDGEIAQVYTDANRVEADDVQIIQGNGRLLMPGFVNSHTHIYSTFARGMPFNPFNPSTFQELLEQLWWRLDRALTLEDIYQSARVASIEMIKNGVTTFIDHHSSPNAIEGSLKEITRACVHEAGLRGILCYEISDRDGEDAKKMAIKENIQARSLKVRYPGKASALMGLHASFTLKDETLQACAGEAMPIHVHVGEGPEDGELHRERFGLTALQRLDRYGLLREDSLLAHCLYVEKGDLSLIKDRDCTVVFNPQSNMNNGAGLPNYSIFSQEAIPVNLGNDGYGFDLTRDMRTLLLSQHLIKLDPVSFSVEDLFDVVFKNNTEYASKLLGTRIGRIESGYKADFIIYDYSSPTIMNAQNFMSHFYFGVMENCKPVDVLIDGEFVLKDSHFCQLDAERIFADAKSQSLNLWNRI